MLSCTYGVNSLKGQQNEKSTDDGNCFVPWSNEVLRNDNDFASNQGQSRGALVGHAMPLPKNGLSTFCHNYCDRRCCFAVIGHGCKTVSLPHCPHSIQQQLVSMDTWAIRQFANQTAICYWATLTARHVYVKLHLWSCKQSKNSRSRKQFLHRQQKQNVLSTEKKVSLLEWWWDADFCLTEILPRHS